MGLLVPATSPRNQTSLIRGTSHRDQKCGTYVKIEQAGKKSVVHLAVRGFLVKRDCIFLFSVIRDNEKLKPVNCESYACRDT